MFSLYILFSIYSWKTSADIIRARLGSSGNFWNLIKRNIRKINVCNYFMFSLT